MDLGVEWSEHSEEDTGKIDPFPEGGFFVKC